MRVVPPIEIKVQLLNWLPARVTFSLSSLALQCSLFRRARKLILFPVYGRTNKESRNLDKPPESLKALLTGGKNAYCFLLGFCSLFVE